MILAYGADHFIKILKSAEKGKYQIIGSPQLELEVSEIKDKSKRENVRTIVSLANIEVVEKVREPLQKEIMELTGLTEEDSFHLAFAIEGKARYFITADDEILQKSIIEKRYNIRIRNPVKFIEEEEHGS